MGLKDFSVLLKAISLFSQLTVNGVIGRVAMSHVVEESSLEILINKHLMVEKTAQELRFKTVTWIHVLFLMCPTQLQYQVKNIS